MLRRCTQPLSVMLFCLISFGLVGRFAAQEKASAEPSLLHAFEVRCIGPANMGGRIVDLAVVESDPATMYVAAATGGLWKTTNAGQSWTPLLDDVTTSMGAVAVAPRNPNVVWVGSGEANPRNSASWGKGVYRSADGGKTWKHMGLANTQHIGRVVIHPQNPEIVYVAALGHIWGPNKERGLYKTSNGGKTWQHVLALDANTGCIDVVLDPSDPDIVYTAAYAVRRDGFSGGNPAKQTGPLAGLYKSTDGGAKFERMTEGLPQGPYGRCGLAVYRKNPNVVYAVVQTAKTPVTTKGQAADKKEPLEAGGIFRSDDKGKTWTHLNSLCPRPFYYGQIRIDPNDDQRIYVLGVSFHVSSDGGRTFSTSKGGAHPDNHALWIDPKDSKHLVLGNDGGLYFSQSRGGSWEAVRGMAIGQFYGIAVDMRKPYRVYGGLQDNGSWGGPVATSREEGITLADWKRIGGGDGFYCQADPTDPDTVYCEMQYGGLKRVNLKTLTGKGAGAKNIKPGGDKGKAGYRFNWSSPLLMSAHDPKTLYYGGNFLFKSTNRGDTWATISPDLTCGKPGMTSTGNTITTIAESPLNAGVLYVGADDGKLQLSRDDGANWTDLSDKIPNVPPDRWVTRVECSHQSEGAAYVTIDRHRNDDRRPYLFKTTDFGATWTSLAANLPKDAPLHVIRESSRNPRLLFAGTEMGLFVSLDGGGRWQRFGKGLPIVPVHDLIIHPRERDLVIATHGRSIYFVNIAALEELNDRIAAESVYLFAPRAALAATLAKADKPATKSFVAPNPPLGAPFYYYLKSKTSGPVALVIEDREGRRLATIAGPTEPGLHRLLWNLRTEQGERELIRAGEFTIRLEAGGVTKTEKLKVESE